MKFIYKLIIKTFYKLGYQKNPLVGIDYDIIYLYNEDWTKSLSDLSIDLTDVLMTVRIKKGLFKDFVITYVYDSKADVINQYILSYYEDIIDSFFNQLCKFANSIIDEEILNLNLKGETNE